MSKNAEKATDAIEPQAKEVDSTESENVERTETAKVNEANTTANENVENTETAGVNKNQAAFPIIGIGASAGGLEALQEFFDNMIMDPGAAFVVIQHLSPDYKSFMGELLGRHTNIPIEVVKDNTKIKINHIYLIPPKMNMTIKGGTLYLKEIIGRSLNLPIDIFFRSLAEDQQGNAVAVILSGTGSDGTLGIRAIKEFGGVTMVQDDQSAKFDGMPRSSISTGMVDLVLPPDELAKELASYIKHPIINHTSPVEDQLMQNQSLYNKIIAILHEAKNVDFSTYKQNTIIRRLEKRISINRFVKVIDYVSYLAATPKEINALFNDLLIGVTRFFRDEKAFEVLSESILPTIFEKHTDKSEIRIWVPGCSTGEEAFTIAILLKDYMSKNSILNDVKIFATDIDEDSLNYAGTGFYPSNISADVPQRYLNKYFSRHDNGYQINDNIRRMIIFARHNVIDEPPFSKLDMVSCRNLLIYIDLETQQKILSTFHVCLKPDGILYLGSSESLGKLADGFDILDSKAKIFKKRNRFKPDFLPASSLSMPLHRNRAEFNLQNAGNMLRQGSRHLSYVFEDIVNSFLPPSVVVDSSCNILYTIRNAGSLLQLPQGQITSNLLKMLPKEVSVAVSGIIRRAEKKIGEIITTDIVTSKQQFNITCKRIITSDDDFACFFISFEEKKVKEAPIAKAQVIPVDLSNQYQERIEELEREIQHKNESLQATVEELETSNEELQSSNEELIASNEELQSTNEELQSVNEELYTVNAEHLRKIEEMTELNTDYDNLLNNTQIGTLYLDKNMVIRKVSKVATQITNILQSDIGRPVHHLALSTLYPNFLKEVDKVHDTQVSIEHELPCNGKNYLMRIVPYRTKDNSTKGIIITFVEFTQIPPASAK